MYTLYVCNNDPRPKQYTHIFINAIICICVGIYLKLLIVTVVF